LLVDEDAALVGVGGRVVDQVPTVVASMLAGPPAAVVGRTL
jgi:hypothetical protein